MIHSKRQAGDNASRPINRDRHASLDPMLVENRRIFTPGRRLEAVVKPRANFGARAGIHVDRHAPAHVNYERPQIIDSMGVVGVFMRQQDGIQADHACVKQLRAQVWRGVDQNARRAARSRPFDQD